MESLDGGKSEKKLLKEGSLNAQALFEPPLKRLEKSFERSWMESLEGLTGARPEKRLLKEDLKNLRRLEGVFRAIKLPFEPGLT